MNFARSVADVVVFMHQGLIWESGPSRRVLGSPETAELAAFVKAEV
jgi:polar amino acid transport system ATP-binding protein